MDTIDILLEKIKINEGFFPQKEIETLIRNSEYMIPRLLSLMEDVRDNYQTYIDEISMLPIYSSFLLAQLRVKEFFPIFMDIAKLPGEITFDLYGDAVTEDFHRIMASVYDGRMDHIYSIIEDPKVNSFVREKGIGALVILVLEDELERDDVIEYLKRYLVERGEEDDPEVISAVVVGLRDLYPEESMEEIKWAFENDLVSSFMMSFDRVQAQLRKEKLEALEEIKSRKHYQLMGSAIKEMSGWACFQSARPTKKLKPTGKGEPKIPRNKPCPCGSGKKYKKCCGK